MWHPYSPALSHQCSWLSGLQTTQTFLVLQLADGRSWDFSASINMWANSYNIYLNMCVCVYSICVCVSNKIRNIYLQKTKTKQTKRELGGGWAGDLRVKRKESPPQGGGLGLTESRWTWILCFPWGGYHTRKARSVSLPPWRLWRAAALSLQPNPAVNSWFVVSITPSHPHAHTQMRAHTHRHSHACASLWLSVMKTVLEHRLLSSGGRRP